MYLPKRNLSFLNLDKTSDKTFLIFSIVISFCFVIIIGEYVFYFPDYYNYERYIVDGTSFIRFYQEPISACIMYAIHYMEGSSYWYYVISILMLNYSYYFLCGTVKSNTKYILFIFLLLNPINLILIQTPRYVIALAFCFLAINANTKIKLFAWSILILLTHTVMGVFFILFITMVGMKNRYNLIIVLIVVGLFAIFTKVIVPLGFERMLSSDLSRGFGRIALFLLAAIYVLLSFRGLSDSRKHIAIVSLLMAALFYMSSFTHRLSSFYFVLLFLYLFQYQKQFINKLTNINFCFLFILGGVYILLSGSYGYSI